MEIKYAKSQNLRSRTKVVGTTPFKFDAEGICKVEVVPGRGRLLYDFAALLKCSGISLYGAESHTEQVEMRDLIAEQAPVSAYATAIAETAVKLTETLIDSKALEGKSAVITDLETGKPVSAAPSSISGKSMEEVVVETPEPAPAPKTTDVAPEPETAEASEKEESAKPKRRRGRKSRKEKD